MNKVGKNSIPYMIEMMMNLGVSTLEWMTKNKFMSENSIHWLK